MSNLPINSKAIRLKNRSFLIFIIEEGGWRLVRTLKQMITSMLPSVVRKELKYLIFVINLSFNYVYDCKRFLKWSAAGRQLYTQTNLRALITMDYHRIEKGLALKEPRVGFGTWIINRLISNLNYYHQNYGFDETCQIALNALFAYYNFNLAHGLQDTQLYQTLVVLKEAIPDPDSAIGQGGVLTITRQDILNAAHMDLKDFFNARHSIRQFAPDEVDMSLIEQAVAMAQKTPSVCNRQSSKVYMFSSFEDKKRVLSYQNGNRGFGEQISKVLIVTSNVEHFTSIGERNQCWIDGGMFAMSLVYALHSLGLATCCLNLSIERNTDQTLKRAANIDDKEALIMMIAVGHLPKNLKVAQSPRKDICEVLIVR